MMKKLLIPLLVLVFLAGCGGQDTSETTQQTTETTVQTQPQGFYVPDSEIEQQTQGAVRLYLPETGTVSYFTAIGERPLLICGEDTVKLTLLTDEAGQVAAEATLDKDTVLDSCQPTFSGLVYYAREQRQAVYLDAQLQETKRIDLPADAQGTPVFSPDGSQIFYSQGQDIRVLDTELGISRLVKTQACTSQTLLGCYFEGTMLACSVEDEAGQQQTVYLSTETGQTMSNDGGLLQLDTYEDQYLAVRMDGTVTQRIFGTPDAAQQLNIADSKVYPALELGGVLGSRVDAEGTLQLSYYDLTSGKMTAAAALPGMAEPSAVYADRWTGCVWILTNQGDSQALLRWDVKSSPVTADAVYTTPVYTADAPDEAGLEACEDRSDDMEDTHGVTIRIWKDAVKYTGGYNVVAEYQTQAINSCLDQLDAVLREFPENFLYKSVATRVRICIVRSISGKTDAVQYWYDGDAFILLSAGADIRNAFMDAVSYVVDSHVLGNSPMYDYWNDLNPEGFVYGDETTYSQEYLEGESIAFFSQESMESATEDRAQVFWQAMKADNAQLFQSETMQKKLLMLCQAIRDAWRLERKTETYPWEQYLEESIAYKKP